MCSLILMHNLKVLIVATLNSRQNCIVFLQCDCTIHHEIIVYVKLNRIDVEDVEVKDNHGIN